MNTMQQIKCHLICLARQIGHLHAGHVAFHVRGTARALHAQRWETTEAQS